jgi:hypothetical protein
MVQLAFFRPERRHVRRICQIAVAGLLAAGCVTAAPEQPVPDIAGAWSGFLIPGGLLAFAGVTSGELQVTFAQRGRAATGDVVGQGLRGTIDAVLFGNQLTGTFRGLAFRGGNVDFQAQVVGDRMEAVLEHSPVTLRKAPATPRVLMKNPRTDQVIACEGAAGDVARCVSALERDDWTRLAP